MLASSRKMPLRSAAFHLSLACRTALLFALFSQLFHSDGGSWVSSGEAAASPDVEVTAGSNPFPEGLSESLIESVKQSMAGKSGPMDGTIGKDGKFVLKESPSPPMGAKDTDAVSSPKPSSSAAESFVWPVTDEEEAQMKDLSVDDEKALNLENHKYQAEVDRLMDIIINSLYTQKEIFLRELVSNAADALEKIRFLSLSETSEGGQQSLGKKPMLDIRVDIDSNARTLSITDTGVGMTKQDLINNLGTVAKSGTSNFLEALANGGDVNLIGQFGVGFYSAFLVADKVTVVSKHNDDAQYLWVSTADGSFSMAEDPRGTTLGRGTRITLHMKEDATEFLNEGHLKELLQKYSQFIAFPIFLKSERTVTEEVPVEEELKEDKEGEEEKDDMEVKDEEEEEKKEKKEKKMRKVEKKVREWTQLNTQKAIWLRPKEEVTEQEYNSFYKSVTKDWTDPISYIHFTGEGEIEFKAILYIPSRAPMDMFDNYFSKQTSIKLYVRRVLVADQFEDLLPKYLHFVKGVVDSDDLPLNVSREQLQQHKIMKVISKKLTRKVIELMRKLSKDADSHRADLRKQLKDEGDSMDKDARKKIVSELEKRDSKFDKVMNEFSRNMKLGCYEDDANRSKVAKVLRFYTNKNTDNPIDLDAYVANMTENQASIYYASGESVEKLKAIPQIQVFDKKGIEVLLLTEAMDEPCIQKLTEFEGKKFESIQKGEVSLEQTDEEKNREKKLRKMYDPLLTWWKKSLGAKVQKVEISRRLVVDPVAVASSQWGYSAYMEKIMKTQTFADSNQIKMMAGQKILEINPDHPVVHELLLRVKTNSEDPQAVSTAEMLYYAALMSSGYDLENPQTMAAHMYRLVGGDIGVKIDPEFKVDVSDVPDEEEEKGEEEEEDFDDMSEAIESKEDVAQEAEEDVTTEEQKEEEKEEAEKEEAEKEEAEKEEAAKEEAEKEEAEAAKEEAEEAKEERDEL
eukprot:GHVQ01006366.1.p1 GENE.GHVQ01006366.1~~GHVQ01006366.1.p1  ORF type:complete len:968 (+),score=236.44 GHVQ01006366.1:259-3162(+)